jgi:hypothetical protein
VATNRGPIQVRRYDEGSAEASALAFQADAARAAGSGYVPASQVWEGSALVVTYQGTFGAVPTPPRSQSTAASSGPAAAARAGKRSPVAWVVIIGILAIMVIVLLVAFAGQR